MKILHVGPIYYNQSDGPTRSIMGLARAQSAIGHDVFLLPAEPENDPGMLKNNPDIKILPSPTERHLNPWVLSDEWIRTIKNIVGTPDVINFHDVYSPFQTSLARLCRKEGWQYILTPRGGLTRLAQTKTLKSYLKKKVGNFLFFNNFVNNASLIHALCENESKDIALFCKKANQFIIPNGIDKEVLKISDMHAPNKTKRFQDNDFVIGFLGRLDIYHKGIDILTSALDILQKKEPGRKIKLLMIGPCKTKKDKDHLKTLIDSLEYPESVELTGPAYGDDKWSFVKACDIFAFPSRFEGMPMAVLETMAMGKPSIVSPGSNMTDIIRNSGGGWLCDGSAESLAKEILKVYKERDIIVGCGINAKEYIKEQLTWDKIAGNWVELVCRSCITGG